VAASAEEALLAGLRLAELALVGPALVVAA